MIHHEFFVKILVTFYVLPIAMSTNLCSLCETLEEVDWYHSVPGGKTCTQIYLELSELGRDSEGCKAQKEIYESICCGEPSSPTVQQGDEPVCKICKTDEYPGIPDATIQARYVGTFSCSQLYWRGLTGYVPDFMCGPLTGYAERACGCGEYNPECIADETKCFSYDDPLRELTLPTVEFPTSNPSRTEQPSLRSSQLPSSAPSETPTSTHPSLRPTKVPTPQPTQSPTDVPSVSPSGATTFPSQEPSSPSVVNLGSYGSICVHSSDCLSNRCTLGTCQKEITTTKTKLAGARGGAATRGKL